MMFALLELAVQLDTIARLRCSESRLVELTGRAKILSDNRPGISPMATVLETNLVRTRGICGGRLRIDGTRMTVNQVVTLHKQGLSAEKIVEEYPHRTRSEIYAVLAWYYAHQEEFDLELAAEAAEDERLAHDIRCRHASLY